MTELGSLEVPHTSGTYSMISDLGVNRFQYHCQADAKCIACSMRSCVRRIYWSALKDYNDELAQEFIDLIGALYKVELESILLHRPRGFRLNTFKYNKIQFSFNTSEPQQMLGLARLCRSFELASLEKAYG